MGCQKTKRKGGPIAFSELFLSSEQQQQKSHSMYFFFLPKKIEVHSRAGENFNYKFPFVRNRSIASYISTYLLVNKIQTMGEGEIGRRRFFGNGSERSRCQVGLSGK